MKILCVDLGFGHNKIVFGDETGIKKLYKFPSVIASVDVNDLVRDDRVISMEGKSFYVGDDALAVQSRSIIDVKNYPLLEYSAPLFISKVMNDINDVPDVIVLGLSIAQISNSAHFKERVGKFLKDAGLNIRIVLLPQGMVAKLAIDKYADNFPEVSTEFGLHKNYIGIDIGFNTLDIFQVINGQTSSNLVRGIPERGIQVIVANLIKDIEENDGVKRTMSEGKAILDTGVYRIRGKDIDCSDRIAKYTEEYIKELMVIVENEFGEVLDKSDAMFIFGGGSYALKKLVDDFIKIPKASAEYYNAIAYFLYVIQNKG
jgi:hypothetical protein